MSSSACQVRIIDMMPSKTVCTCTTSCNTGILGAETTYYARKHSTPILCYLARDGAVQRGKPVVDGRFFNITPLGIGSKATAVKVAVNLAREFFAFISRERKWVGDMASITHSSFFFSFFFRVGSDSVHPLPLTQPQNGRTLCP